MRSIAARRAFLVVLGAGLPALAAVSAHAQEFVYLGNSLGGDISIISVATQKVVGTIPATVVGNHPDDVIASRNGEVLYISRLDVNS